ncbi:MAG: murein biosynthesis integral membrane protein MurJ [Verrucomicrobia bacterium]|nr:murein biosynthesis integral membrane protein MurJ [Verrucomicrobiota bacterium]
MTEQTRQYQAMAKTASWTMVSRVLGLFRDQLTTAVFGASAIGSAFLFAFTIPNLFRRLLGEGALTAAVVPVLADKSARDGKTSAFGFLNFVLRKALPWMVGLTLVSIGAALLWSLVRPKDAAAAVLTAVCMPYMPLICVAALFTSAVNLSGRFGLAEVASGVLNLCMIVALGVGGENFAATDMGKAVWLSLGALVGGLCQLLIPMWGLRQEGWHPRLNDADAQAWKTLSVAFLPAALGAGVQQINVLASRSIAFGVSDESLTYYYVANRIVELPIGLFSASIAVVIFPALATAFAGRDVPALARNYGRGMRLVLAINVGAAFGLIAFAVPIVQLLFNYGNFRTGDCANTSRLLVIFALAMPFYAMISIVTRALNVAGQTKATLVAAVHALIVNATGSAVAVWLSLGVEGLAWANALSTLWQYAVLRHHLRKHAPEFLGESLFKPATQVLAGSVLLAVVAFQGYAFLHNVLAGHLNEKVNLVVSMGLAGGAGMALYAVFLDKLGYPERDLLRGYANKVLRLFGLQLRA